MMDRWIRLPRNRDRDNTIIKPQPIRTCQWPRKRCGRKCRRSEQEWINFIDFPQPLFTLWGWLDQKLGQELKVPYWEHPPIIVRFNCYPCWLFVGQPMGPSFLGPYNSIWGSGGLVRGNGATHGLLWPSILFIYLPRELLFRVAVVGNGRE